jgi:hypothetical protein
MSKDEIRKDAQGQYAKPMKGSKNNGVASAKPRVITGDDDATGHKTPPGQKPIEKEWDINFDIRESNESDFRG